MQGTMRTYGRILGGFTGLVLIGFLALGAYGWGLYQEVEERFSGRRWSIPSRILSDATLLYPGMRINRSLFMHKLRRLDYRPVGQVPQKKGEMRAGDNTIELFLHDLQLPDEQRAGFGVRLVFDGQTLARLEKIISRSPLPLVTLEPEKLGLFFGEKREMRHLVAIGQMPQVLIDAVIAAEDSRFFEHFGLDWRGIGRALLANLRSGRIRQGGSTITQQLAKNYFLTAERTLGRKWKEMILAFVLEWRYEKIAILEMYLNEIYFGQNGSISINGVGEASRFYFGKAAEEITLSEAAILAGMIKSPNIYSPQADGERCRQRRDAVLRVMFQRGRITAEAYEKARVAAVKPAEAATHRQTANYFIDYLSRQLAELYAPEDLTSLGLSIFTTLDTQVQEAAETALVDGLLRIEGRRPGADSQGADAERLQGAVIVMKPQTGAVLAMVGGRDYRQSQFNRAVQARRQAGSTFKVFTYLAALDTYSPIAVLSNQARTYEIDGKPWRPRNHSALDAPVVSLREGLARSVNRATVDLAMQVGIDAVIQTAGPFGFTARLAPYPSLALGAVDVVPLELARAYCVFPNDGLLPNPIALQDVIDDRGQLLARRHLQVRRVIAAERAFMMTALLKSAVLHGTARGLAARGIHFPVAGKTGTTNNSRDAWFVGYTPDILILVWVGYDSGASIQASGAEAALPIWADLIRAIPHQISGSDFNVPPGVAERTICTKSGFPALDGDCDEILPEWFLADNIPRNSVLFRDPDSAFEQWVKKLKEAVDGE